MKEEKEDIENIEKVSFANVAKTLIEPEIEEDQKEEIARYNIPEDVKKQLLQTLKKVEDEIMKPTNGGFARKTKGVIVAKEEGKKHLKENPIKVEIDERTGEVLKKKSRKVVPVRNDDEELSK